MGHSPHLCVCLGVAKIRRQTQVRKCSYQGDGNQHPEWSYAALRLQSVLSTTWTTDQTATQGERTDAPRFDRSSRLSLDPDSADRKGRRDLHPDAVTRFRNLPDPNREAFGRHRFGGQHRTTFAVFGTVRSLATTARTLRKPQGVRKFLLGIYYLSAVSGRVCDTPSSLFISVGI